MIVYFIRHGESEGNALDIHQNAATPLSDIGRSQAAQVALRFNKIPIELILASDHVRTIQTAEIVNSKLHKPIVTSPLLQEFHRPSELIGKRTRDPMVLEIQQLLHDHRNKPDWHYSDEENFYDFSLRARQCLRMIGDQKESKILCVTHGIMLVMLVSVVIFGDDLTPDHFGKILHGIHNKNTGITIFGFDEGRWELKTLNDHEHLGLY